MQKVKQLQLIPFKMTAAFGGSLLKNSNAKSKRPFSSKNDIHIVMRSSLAKGSWSFLKSENRKRVDWILHRQAKRWGVQLRRYENVGNHLHLLVHARHRRLLAGFLRSISGLIARAITGAERGSAQSFERFWDAKPFSRIVANGRRSFLYIQSYFNKNKLRALGFDLVALAKELGLEERVESGQNRRRLRSKIHRELL